MNILIYFFKDSKTYGCEAPCETEAVGGTPINCGQIMNSNIKITIIINNTLTKRLYEMCSIVLLNVGRKKHCVLHNVTFTMLYKKMDRLL